MTSLSRAIAVMWVSVHLHTILQKQTDQGLVDRLEVELPGGSRVADLLGKLEIEIHPDALLLAVNGRVAEPERLLEDGDEVNLMPAISGGCSNGLGVWKPDHIIWDPIGWIRR
jgi:sulfur carrier protein ThiS